VCVELARVVTRAVVVGVADWRQRTVDHTLHTMLHLDGAGHFADHLLFSMIHPLPPWTDTSISVVKL